MNEIVEIPIKNIDTSNNMFPDRWNGFNKEDAELTVSINVVGLIQPIIVRPIHDSENKYSLVDGFRRIKAKQLLGHKTIMCKIIEFSNSDTIGAYLSCHLGCKSLDYEQTKRSIYTLKGIMGDMKERGTIDKDRVEELEGYIKGIEKQNIPPLNKKITGAYYCWRCGRNHIRGKIYKDHKYYAEK